MFQPSIIKKFRRLLSLLPWFLLVEKEVVTLEEVVVADVVLNAYLGS